MVTLLAESWQEIWAVEMFQISLSQCLSLWIVWTEQARTRSVHSNVNVTLVLTMIERFSSMLTIARLCSTHTECWFNPLCNSSIKLVSLKLWKINSSEWIYIHYWTLSKLTLNNISERRTLNLRSLQVQNHLRITSRPNSRHNNSSSNLRFSSNKCSSLRVCSSNSHNNNNSRNHVSNPKKK